MEDIDKCNSEIISDDETVVSVYSNDSIEDKEEGKEPADGKSSRGKRNESQRSDDDEISHKVRKRGRRKKQKL